jgi:hypothetical protein
MFQYDGEPMMQYDPLPTAADCRLPAINAALAQIGSEATAVSSDVYVSTAWTDRDVESLQKLLQDEGSLANRVRKDKNLRPFEWYVECCGKRVGCNPPS